MRNTNNGKQNGNTLDVPALENWLWEAACTIRGPLDAPKFKDYILPWVRLQRRGPRVRPSAPRIRRAGQPRHDPAGVPGLSHPERLGESLLPVGGPSDTK